MLCLAERIKDCATLFRSAGSGVGLVNDLKQFLINTGDFADLV